VRASLEERCVISLAMTKEASSGLKLGQDGLGAFAASFELLEAMNCQPATNTIAGNEAADGEALKR
jgi:hypothetical protein